MSHDSHVDNTQPLTITSALNQMHGNKPKKKPVSLSLLKHQCFVRILRSLPTFGLFAKHLANCRASFMKIKIRPKIQQINTKAK